MKVDARFTSPGLETIAAMARRFEETGYDGVWTPDSKHDPFLPLAVAAGHTKRVDLGTSIAVAFARTPMTVAYAAYDLQLYSHGRFVLGLGSQVKAHIERRFSMTWSDPVKRMREFVGALRAIWRAWDEGTKLDFAGDYYTHTLMPPPFAPERHEYGPPLVYLAAVGAPMTRAAAETANGLFAHAFTTERYLRDVTLPAVESGLTKSGRVRSDFEICLPVYVATGNTEAELATATRLVRDQIAFYGSTPAYHRVLAHHGWDVLADELHALSRSELQDKWKRMGDAVDGTVLGTFAIVSEPTAVAQCVVERYTGIADRVSFHAPYPHDPNVFEAILADVKRLSH